MSNGKEQLTAKIGVNEISVDWDLNPRETHDEDLIETYQKGISNYYESYGPEKAFDYWGQTVQVSKDNVVTRGCHTVVAGQRLENALNAERKKEDPNQERITLLIPVEVAEVSSEDIDKMRFYAAESNIHGKQLSKKELDVAINWYLQGMNLTKNNEDPDKEPYKSDRKVAAIFNVSYGKIHKMRRELRNDPIEINKGYVKVADREEPEAETEEAKPSQPIQEEIDIDENGTREETETRDEGAIADIPDDEDVSAEDRTAELQRQVDGLNNQIKEMEETPLISSEFDPVVSDDEDDEEPDEDDVDETDEVDSDSEDEGDGDEKPKQSKPERRKEAREKFYKSHKDAENEIFSGLSDDDLEALGMEIGKVASMINKAIQKSEHKSFKRSALEVALAPVNALYDRYVIDAEK